SRHQLYFRAELGNMVCNRQNAARLALAVIEPSDQHGLFARLSDGITIGVLIDDCLTHHGDTEFRHRLHATTNSVWIWNRRELRLHRCFLVAETTLEWLAGSNPASRQGPPANRRCARPRLRHLLRWRHEAPSPAASLSCGYRH